MSHFWRVIRHPTLVQAAVAVLLVLAESLGSLTDRRR